MYSSIDNPTHDEWVVESNRLLEELKNHFEYYTKKINEYQEKENDFMLRYYCLKLLEANSRLKIGEVVASKVIRRNS